MTISSALTAPNLKVDLPQAVFTDFSSLAALRNGADGGEGGEPDGEQLEEAARQFSSIFLHMALKSMRDASFGGGLLDSQQSEFYRDMFDQQLALDLSDGDGFGLTQLIVDQLSQSVEPAAASPALASPAIASLARVDAVQAYSRVAQSTQATQTTQETSGSADNKTNGQVPGGLDRTETLGRPGTDKTTRLAIP